MLGVGGRGGGCENGQPARGRGKGVRSCENFVQKCGRMNQKRQKVDGDFANGKITGDMAAP